MSADQTPSDDAKSVGLQFALEEYRTLRAEIERHDKHREKLQYGSVAGSLIVVAWIVSLRQTANADIVPVVALVPPVIVFAGWWIARCHVERSKKIGRYIRTVEARYADGARGWEHFIDVEEERPAKPPKSARGTVSKPIGFLMFFIAAFEVLVLAAISWLQLTS